jgi:hypothetical protein
VGYAMGNQMTNAFATQQQPSTPSQTPPPLPVAVSFFVAVNGQQSGPFDLVTLQAMSTRKEFRRDSLVWKQGMSGWLAAGQVAELNSVFSSTPPPIPS